MNASMPALARCFELEGFSDVRTLLSSGNVAFDARSTSPAALERRAERAMQAGLGRSFQTFVRPAAQLRQLVDSDPYAGYALQPASKKIVTFLRHPVDPKPVLPIERDDACIVAIDGLEALGAYVPGPKGPLFMRLLERTFGKDITTRTLDTVRKCARA